MRPPPTWTWAVAAAAASGLLANVGCGIVDLGDNIVPPDLQLDEEYFYCVIQPQILTAKSCAGGGPGEGGMCHADRSALRLIDTDMPPPECDADGTITGGVIPGDYVANFEAVRFTVQSDPLSSPFYRRPTGMDSHPRVVYEHGDECADLVFEWINRGAL